MQVILPLILIVNISRSTWGFDECMVGALQSGKDEKFKNLAQGGHWL